MGDTLLAVGRVVKVEEVTSKGNTNLVSTLKVIHQEADGAQNAEPNLKQFLVKGQLEFGKRYEVVIRIGAQEDLPLRMFREDDETVPAPPSTIPATPFRRPKKQREWYEDDDEDIQI